MFLESLAHAVNQGAVRPGARQGYIEMIPSQLRGKTAFARRPRRTIRRDPMTECRCGTNELPTGSAGIIPIRNPCSVFKSSHEPQRSGLEPQAPPFRFTKRAFFIGLCFDRGRFCARGPRRSPPHEAPDRGRDGPDRRSFGDNDARNRAMDRCR